MGDEKSFIPKANPENPKGFYENIHFRLMNDAVLERNNYVVKDWNTEIPDVDATLLQKFKMAKLILRHHLRSRVWGWKDPRTCIVLGSWLEVLNYLGLSRQVKLIITMRDPTSVALSMVKRDNATFNSCLELWCAYHEHCLTTLEANRHLDCMTFNYERFAARDETTLRRLGEFIDVSWDEKVVERSVSSQLNRQGCQDRNVEIPQFLHQRIATIWSRLAAFDSH